jgi:DNA-binding HxlR family transcriptional regulator
MRRTRFDEWPCPIARATDLVGDWWTPLVLRESYYGVRRFEDFQKTLGIGRNILTQRLNRLVDEGLLVRRPYQEKPLRNEYVLTDKGRDFYPVLAAMIAWGDRWLSGEEGPPIVLKHKACGHDMTAKVVCSECGEPIQARDIRPRLGPGYPPGQAPPGPRVETA